MKKLSKILMFSLLGLVLGLSSCNVDNHDSHPGGGQDGNDKERTTYLVLGEGGLYNGEPGQSFAHLSLDNSVEFVAEVGSDLPNASVVTNSNGQVLHYWYSVDGTGHESVTYTVPNAEYSVLYAKYGNGTASIMRVYFKSPDSWTNANIYCWGANNEAMAGWPGTPMAKAENGLWYFDYDTSTYFNVIFNNGTDQTADLKSPTSEDRDCYVWMNGWYNDDTDELPGGTGSSGGGTDTPSGDTMRVYFKAPSDWFQAYIYMWNQSSQNDYATWPGTAMELDSDKGLFYFDYDTTYYDGVIFSNGTGTQTEDLTSPTSEDADCYVWKNGWYNEDTTEVPATGGATGGSGEVNTEEKALYFIPNNEWKSDNARFAAYFFGNGETWISLVDSNADGVYEVTAPAGYPNIIFCRMNPSIQENNWNEGTKWNQTGDLVIPTNADNCFKMSPGSWDSGTWTTFAG